jgi:vitamin K-dependent gamma-carboxylase-like protein
MAISPRLQRPVDAASLAAFRIAFGSLLLLATLRSFWKGTIAEQFLIPTHFFKYWGFAWVRPWPGAGMYLHFGSMAACALGIALGYRYRASVLGFALLFGYAHLIDKTNYLNHYYLVLCVCSLMACLPLAGMWSLDSWRRPQLRRSQVEVWMVWLLRAQFGLVYLFGGIAKLNGDWLLRALPLSIWLGRSSDLPLLGQWLTEAGVAQAMSWAGAVFDLSIVPLLCLRRTRLFAFVAVVAFHLLTARLFSIGLFPYFMICGSLLFLPPSWPRRALRWLGVEQVGEPSPAFGAARWVSWAALGFMTLQLLIPLRHWLYPGDPRWTEQGFRFSWNVMLMEKDGAVDFRVVEPRSGRVFHASPRDYFTPYQVAMMSPQPDMVLEAAQLVARDFRARGVEQPAVYADAFASLNGRPMQRLIDPNVDLARETDGLWNKTWILPMNPTQPSQMASLARSSE